MTGRIIVDGGHRIYVHEVDKEGIDEQKEEIGQEARTR